MSPKQVSLQKNNFSKTKKIDVVSNVKLKSIFAFSIVFFSALLMVASCKKQETNPLRNVPAGMRKIQFSLYTDKDFSGYNEKIVFTLSIRRSTSRVIWDSVLPPMKVKDIPTVANKLVIEKIIPESSSSLLKVGFIYSIENVGMSWFWDKSNPGETFKKVDFNFQ